MFELPLLQFVAVSVTCLASTNGANSKKKLRMYPRKVLPKRRRHNRIDELTPLLHVGVAVASICGIKGYLSSQN